MGTITSSREIDAMFRSGSRTSHPLMTVIVSPTPEERGPRGRVAFIAGKRLGGAVARNRAKRVLRETARRVGGPWAGYDVLILAREGTATATPRDLDAALQGLLRRHGLSS